MECDELALMITKGWQLPDKGECLSVKGRLGKCVKYWRHELCAPPWMVDTISTGYVLPLMSEPTPYKLSNQYILH